MQQALENPHYKKIWKKVIMNRHLEKEDFYDALDCETQYWNCIASDYEKCWNEDGELYNHYFELPYFKFKKKDRDGVRVLGCPITLEDILMLLPFYIIQGFNTSQEKISINVHYNMGLDECFIEYQLTKPLHEQTPKTWEKIANLTDCI